VAVGGGSSIDTAKAINLLTTNPGDLMDYVNKPVGGGKAPTQPLKPLVAVPTTAGTGAESTAMCILDILALKVKTGISHPKLRPALAVVDPLTTLTLPPHVTASCGMDVLCHALESYTARHYRSYPRRRPEQRAVYVGNKPHACGYPIAGRVARYRPLDYPQAEPMVPHGESVALTAPAAFRFTFPTDPERHLRAAELLDPSAGQVKDPRDRLPQAIVSLMRDIGVPNGAAAVGYAHADIPDLVAGALKQQRILTMAPRDVMAEDLEGIFSNSMRNW
jgi:hydroxyacid-oxoacid transhydrogenase